MEFVLPTFTTATIVSLGISLYLAIKGLIQLFTGKAIGHNFDRYTAESVKRYARPTGIICFLIGTCVLFAEFVRIPSFESLRLTLYGTALGLLVLYLIVALAILKKEK